MIKKTAIRIGLILTLIPLLYQCNLRDKAPAEEPIEMKIYAVPPGISGDEVANQINIIATRLAGTERSAPVTAEMMPSGELLLVGSKQIQEDFGTILGNLKPNIATVENITLTLWVLIAVPGQEAAVATVGDLPDPLTRALVSIDGNQPMGYQVIDRMRVVATKGERSKTDSAYFSFTPKIYSYGETALTSIQLRGHAAIIGSLETLLRLELDRYIVIGESRFMVDRNHRDKVHLDFPSDARIYYVLHAAQSKMPQ